MKSKKELIAFTSQVVKSKISLNQEPKTKNQKRKASVLLS